MLRSIPGVSVLVVVTLFMFAKPANAQDPFAGSASSDLTDGNIGDCFDETDFTFSGDGVPLGSFTGNGHQRVDYCSIGPDIEGDATFTDENGDQISIHYVGQRVDLLSYVCQMTATGGTGRYEGATVDGTITIPNYSVEHPFDGTFDGAIQYP